jgi:hypothetical protein
MDAQDWLAGRLEEHRTRPPTVTAVLDPNVELRAALVEGEPGAVWATDGNPRVVFTMLEDDGR